MTALHAVVDVIYFAVIFVYWAEQSEPGWALFFSAMWLFRICSLGIIKALHDLHMENTMRSNIPFLADKKQGIINGIKDNHQQGIICGKKAVENMYTLS